MGEVLGSVVIIAIRLFAWIACGIYTFNKLGVDDFGSAVIWIFAWSVTTWLVQMVIIFIIGGIAALFND